MYISICPGSVHKVWRSAPCSGQMNIWWGDQFRQCVRSYDSQCLWRWLDSHKLFHSLLCYFAIDDQQENDQCNHKHWSIWQIVWLGWLGAELLFLRSPQQRKLRVPHSEEIVKQKVADANPFYERCKYNKKVCLQIQTTCDRSPSVTIWWVADLNNASKCLYACVYTKTNCHDLYYFYD